MESRLVGYGIAPRACMQSRLVGYGIAPRARMESRLRRVWNCAAGAYGSAAYCASWAKPKCLYKKRAGVKGLASFYSCSVSFMNELRRVCRRRNSRKRVFANARASNSRGREAENHLCYPRRITRCSAYSKRKVRAKDVVGDFRARSTK